MTLEQSEFEHYRFIADKGQKPLRVDKFLLNFIEFATRSKIQQSIKTGNVKVNNQVIRSNYKVKPEDVVTIAYDFPKKEYDLVPQDIPLDIMYEDDCFLIVNKKAGMVVHPGFGNYDGTMANALAFHFDNLPNKGQNDRPGIVHRIDKDTSGLLVIAKTDSCLSVLSKKFEERNIRRTYVALVWGDIKKDSDTIIGNIGRSLKNRKVMSVFPDGEYGKHAVSHYKVIERFGYTTLVECKLETGRTHQIRAHFKYIGHPLFNDKDYGGDTILKGTTFTKYKQFVKNCFKVCPRHALHAMSLGFSHPVTEKDMSFNSDIDENMNLLIEKWRKYSESRSI